MTITTAYQHASRIGVFTIAMQPNGRWCIRHEGENLGAGYLNPQSAVDDLAGGHCDWPGVTDPSSLGLSDDIGDWEAILAKR